MTHSTIGRKLPDGAQINGVGKMHPANLYDQPEPSGSIDLTDTRALRSVPHFQSIAATQRQLGIGKTSVFKMINLGELKIAKIGRRTLITAESVNALIEASLVKRGS